MDRRCIWHVDGEGIDVDGTGCLRVDIRRRKRSDDDRGGGGGMGVRGYGCGRSGFHDGRSVGTVCGGNWEPAQRRISRMVANDEKRRSTDRFRIDIDCTGIGGMDVLRRCTVVRRGTNQDGSRIFRNCSPNEDVGKSRGRRSICSCIRVVVLAT